MHELSVCQAIIHEVESIARDRAASSVDRIVVKLGPLSGVERTLLEQAYPIARAGTIADSAELIIETMPVTVHCEQCGAESEVPVNRLLCANCGNWRTRVTSGDEMLLASVSLKTDRITH